jgi:hypothetical protein
VAQAIVPERDGAAVQERDGSGAIVSDGNSNASLLAAG